MGLESGPAFAVLTALCFGVAQVLVRRTTYQTDEAFTPVAFSVLIGTPVFIVIVLVSGEWDFILSFTWRDYLMLGAAGFLQFIAARYLFFNGTRIIGANPIAAITRSNIVFAVILGVSFLGESVTAVQVIGALLIMAGAVLSSMEINRDIFRISRRGLLMGLGAGLCSAGSAALIRPVMVTTDAVYAATCVSYLAAFIIIVAFLLARGQQRANILRQGKYNNAMLLASALALVIGHICRFSALQLSPVSIVGPLMGTIVIFVLALSWIINRRIDAFNWRVIAGICMVLAGVFLIY